MATKQARQNNARITNDNLIDMQNSYDIDMNRNKPNPVAAVADFSKRILNASNVSLIGGPFHYSVRSGTYGDPYDEIPWKVRMGMAEPKPRQGYNDNPFICTYGSGVLLNNWVEERRDRNYIKYNAPRLSQYGHHYVSESMRTYTKPMCNKQRDILLNIATFPITAHPYHQPELNVETLRMSAPKPEDCVVDETIEQCRKDMEQDKRYYKASL